MKGFTDKKGKFHPITDYKGVRKSRNQNAKTQGVKYDGLGRRLPVKLGKIGDIVKVSQGSGIDSGKVGKIIGRKPAQDFPQSETDWYQVRVIKPEHMKGVVIQSPRDRLEKISLERKARYAFGDDEETQEITPDYSVGDIVMVSPDNDNQGYDDFRNKKLRITMVATNRDEHRGFDEGVGQALYELETLDGEEIGSSLYDYELESA